MFSAHAKPVAWPLFIFFYFLCSLIGVMMPYLSVYYKSIGLTASEIGRLVSIVTLSSILIPHFWGWLTSRSRLPRRTLQLSVTGTFLVLLPFNWTTDFMGLWWLTLALALFYSAQMPLADSLAIRSIRNLNVPYTRVRVGGSIGYIIAVSVAGYLIDYWGPRVVIPAMTLFMAAAWLTTWFIKEQPIDSGNRHQKGQFLALLKEKEIQFFLLLAFLSYLAHAPFNVFFAVHLGNAGYSGDQIGLLIAFGVIIEIVLFLFFSGTIRRFAVVHVVAFCFICGTARWFMVGWFAEHLWVVLLTQLTHCVTFAVFHMISIEQVHRLFPEQYAAQGQTLYSAFAIGLGGGVGMVSAGYLWEWSGGAWTFTGASVVSGIALIILLASQRDR